MPLSNENRTTTHVWRSTEDSIDVVETTQDTQEDVASRAGQKPHALLEAVEDDQKERLEDLEAVRNTRIEAAEDKAKKAEAGVQKPGAEALAQKRSSTNSRWCNLALDEDKAKEAEVPLRELDRAKIRALRTQKRSAEEARLQEAGYINGKPAEVPPRSTTTTAKVRPTEKVYQVREEFGPAGV